MIPVAGAVLAARAEERKTPPPNIPKGAKVFIAPIGDGFETYLKEAIAKKQVPVGRRQPRSGGLRNHRRCR
jgi:hypothetical protein